MTDWLKNTIFRDDQRTRELVVMTLVAVAMISGSVVIISLWLARPG